jgi:hypothetical protein
MARRHEDRQRVRGLDVQEKLRKLQGKSRTDLVADKERKSASPLGGHRKKAEGGSNG